MTIVVSDFRAIKQAKLELVDGITFMSALNSSGKSCLLRALKCFLDNYSSESNLRHGTERFSIGVKLSSGDSLIYTRTKGSTFIKFNNEPVKTKLGRGSLVKIESRFSFKRVEFNDIYFYPYLNFQNQVPLFDDVEVVEVFSAMFGDIAKLSDRIGELRTSIVKSKQLVHDSEATVQYIRETLFKQKEELTLLNSEVALKRPRYDELLSLENRVHHINTLNQSLSELISSFNDPLLKKAAYLYEKALPLFKTQKFVDDVDLFLKESTRTKSLVSSLEGQLKFISAVDLDLLLDVLSFEQAKVKFNSYLVDVHRSLSQIDIELNSITEQLKGTVCPYMDSCLWR
jgi:DNA repair ATPase RecN